MSARPDQREQRLVIAVGLNIGIVVVQVIIGLRANSLGLLADAVHNVTDVAALGLAALAIRMSRRPPTLDHSFGWHRTGVLAAQANAALLMVSTAWIGYEAIDRLRTGQSVQGSWVIAAAAAGLVVNLAAARIITPGHDHGSHDHDHDHDGHDHDHHDHGGHGHDHDHDGHDHGAPLPGGHHHDLGTRSALLHLLGDAAASGGVLAAGLLITWRPGLTWLDPIASLTIGALILIQAVRLLQEANSVLLETSPPGLDVEALARDMADQPGVDTVHDIHVWQIAPQVAALSAHVVVDGHPTLEDAQVVAQQLRSLVRQRHGITHATLELECESCATHGPVCTIETLPR